jgi:hypothetical protein
MLLLSELVSWLLPSLSWFGCYSIFVYMYIMHWRDYKDRHKFHLWIPKLELNSHFLYLVDTIRIRAELIDMTQIQTKTRKHQISEMLAIAAMTLLLIHIADGSMERISKDGFLPANIDKMPFGISNFGISSIILFFLAFGVDIRGKNKSNVTTTLLIVGGALIGTTALGVSAMDKTGLVATFLTVSAIGYVIMGSGILRAVQQRRYASKIV